MVPFRNYNYFDTATFHLFLAICLFPFSTIQNEVIFTIVLDDYHIFLFLPATLI